MKNQSVFTNKAYSIDAAYNERDKLRKEVRRLRKAMAELRKDKVRLDALEHIMHIGGAVNDWVNQQYSVMIDGKEIAVGETIRDVLDAYLNTTKAKP